MQPLAPGAFCKKASALKTDSLKHHSGATEALFAKRCLPFAA